MPGDREGLGRVEQYAAFYEAFRMLFNRISSSRAVSAFSSLLEEQIERLHVCVIIEAQPAGAGTTRMRRRPCQQLHQMLHPVTSHVRPSRCWPPECSMWQAQRPFATSPQQRQIPIDLASISTESEPPRFPPVTLVRRLPTLPRHRTRLSPAGVRQPFASAEMRVPTIGGA